jgi:hypothetical protein
MVADENLFFSRLGLNFFLNYNIKKLRNEFYKTLLKVP